MPQKGRPALRAVLLEDALPVSLTPAAADITVVDSFEVPTMPGDIASQVAELSQAVTGRIQSLDPQIVVVRRADMPQRPSNADGPRWRLMATGAVAATARLLVPHTVVRTGRECGAAHGTRKEDVDAEALALVGKQSLVEAAAAALSGLVHDRWS
ncbi:hypothetical protein EAH86_10400 [Pedococcus bigeumensis]|uniref:Uncharacterized protein n=2 Tax=Pedococcus bigeumensis TaxID=433644 RepID=A0A502CWX8_9MICO|nr:hypothetical protein EAH86_10400 [Pedococcus bigeumensis]